MGIATASVRTGLAMTEFKLQPIVCHCEGAERPRQSVLFGDADSHNQSADWSRNDKRSALAGPLGLCACGRGGGVRIATASEQCNKAMCSRKAAVHRHIALFFLSPLKVKPSMGAPVRTGFAMTDLLLRSSIVIARERSDRGNP